MWPMLTSIQEMTLTLHAAIWYYVAFLSHASIDAVSTSWANFLLHSFMQMLLWTLIQLVEDKWNNDQYRWHIIACCGHVFIITVYFLFVLFLPICGVAAVLSHFSFILIRWPCLFLICHNLPDVASCSVKSIHINFDTLLNVYFLVVVLLPVLYSELCLPPI